MRIRITGIVMVVFCVMTMAQENDTSALGKNNVAVVKKMQFVHAFINNKDTCLYDLKKYDKDTRLIYGKVDMNCVGMQTLEETILKYDKSGLDHIISRQDDLDFSKSTYIYDTAKGKDPEKIKVFFFQTNDSMSINTTYYKNDTGRLDSSETLVTMQDGSQRYTQNVARYNEQGGLVQLATADAKGELIEMASYELDEEKRLLSAAFATYGENPYFGQTYYQYNQRGQIANTVNTVNQKQEYFYYDNGLLNNILSYNPKGVLEIEYIFLYEFY
jgi:5-hydroxyisourate hydrolase-like protein (transthyretin family)